MRTTEYDRYLEGLARLRAPAVEEAERLLEQDRFDDAERVVRHADDSIYGAVEISRLYRRHLEGLVAAGVTPERRERVEAVFRRALYAAWGAYPEPHTEVEAANYASGRAEDRAGLIRVLGYDPDVGQG